MQVEDGVVCCSLAINLDSEVSEEDGRSEANEKGRYVGEEGVDQVVAFTPQYAPIKPLLRTRKCYTRNVILGHSPF